MTKDSGSKSIVPGGVDEYIAKFAEPVRAKLIEIRKVIQEIAPDAVETVSYFGIPGYSYEGYDYNGMFVWFSFDNKNIRLHLRPPVLEDFSTETQKYSRTKSIIKFSPEQEIPTKLVKRLVGASLNVMTRK